MSEDKLNLREKLLVLKIEGLGNKENKIYICAFLLPLFLGVLLAVVYGYEPFGSYNMLESDVKGQYIPFLNYLKGVFSGEHNLTYSLQKGMGGEMLGLASYYLISPYNLVAAFFRAEKLHYAIEIIVLLKVATSGFTMNYFLTKSTGCSYYSLFFSTSYCYMAYNIAYYYNIMWFDGVVLLPLILLGLSRLLQSGRHNMLYILCLACGIITNYYIGWMICVFCSLYIIYYQIKERAEFKIRLRQCVVFLMDSIAAAGISAWILVPTYHTLMESSKKITEVIRDFSFNYSAWELWTQVFPFAEMDKLDGKPNLFCGTLICVLCITMLFYNKITLREKMALIFVIAVFLLSFCWNFLNLIWHGFKYNISYPYRYAFLFSFFFILTGYQVFWILRREQFWVMKRWILPCLAMVQIVEIIVFAGMHLDKGIMMAADYEYGIQEVKPHIDKIVKQDTIPCRIEKTFQYTSNDAMLMGYHGLSHHTSTANSATLETLNYYGIREISNGSIYRHGITTVADSLLGVGYILNKGVSLEQRYQLYEKGDELDIYYNQYRLPLGFICAEGIDNLWEPNDEANPFEMQNHLVQAMTDSSIVPYEEISLEMSVSNLILNEEKEYIVQDKQMGGSICFKLPGNVLNSHKNVFANIFIRTPEGLSLAVNGLIVEECFFEEYQTIDLQPYLNRNADNEIKIICAPNATFKLEIAAFYMENLDAVQEWHDIVLENGVMLQSQEDSYITGMIQVHEESPVKGRLVFSLPYHSGWRAIIDGVEVEAQSGLHGLLTFDISHLQEGEHEIVLKYNTVGLKEGILISSIFTIVIVAVWFYQRKGIVYQRR